MSMDLNLISSKLFDALIHKSGIQDIIEIGYEILGNPMGYGDIDGKLIASSNNFFPFADPLSIETGINTYISNEKLNSSEFKRINSLVDKSNSPVLLHKPYGIEYDCIEARVLVENKIVGHIFVIGSLAPFTETDIKAVSLICEALSLEMIRSGYIKNKRAVRHENFFIDLLNGAVKEDLIINDRLKALKMKLEEDLYVFTVSLANMDDLTTLPHISAIIEGKFKNNISVIYNNNIVLLFSFVKDTSFTNDYFDSLLDFFKNNNLYGGLSNCFHNLSDIRKFYEQTLKLIDIGTIRDRDKRIYFYMDYFIDYLIDILSNTVELKEYCHPKLIKLIKYDQKNHMNFSQTLYFYILNKGNLADTANALFIHRNTLLYRIQKIESIMGLPLGEAKTLVHLYLSFNILVTIHNTSVSNILDIQEL